MTQQTDQTEGFRARKDQLHDWAMDLSHFASRLMGNEPHHKMGCHTMEIAARMEERAAGEQPEENLHWKTILHRSAGWMYAKAASGNPALLEDAERCVSEGLKLHPAGRGELEEVQNEIYRMREPEYAEEDPKPWITCFRCRVPVVWSAHSPREIHAKETHVPGLNQETAVAYLCSQCEWQAITGGAEPREEGERNRLLAKAVREIEVTLSTYGRGKEASEIASRMREGEIHPQEAEALITTMQENWGGPWNYLPGVRTCAQYGYLVPFGIAQPE